MGKCGVGDDIWEICVGCEGAEVKGAVLDGGCGVMLMGFTVSAIFAELCLGL